MYIQRKPLYTMVVIIRSVNWVHVGRYRNAVSSIGYLFRYVSGDVSVIVFENFTKFYLLYNNEIFNFLIKCFSSR